MRYVQVCKALYDYESRTEDELSIKENDILYIIEKEDDDWWRAELKQQNGEDQGPVGLVPADYLEEVTPIGRVRAEFDYAAQQEEELSFEEGDEMDLLEQDDPDWFLVKSSKGEIGLAPSNYVQDADDHFEEAQEQQLQQDPIPTPPVVTQTSMPPPPPVQPILSHTTGSTTATREVIADDAQSWNVHEYDAAKKKKKKGKGSLFVGNGMICYGSETDKSLPVQQYPILDVTKYLYDGKNLHIEIDGTKQAVLDLQASSKSEAKAILVKISDSTRAAQMSNTHLSLQSQKQIAAPAPAIPPMTSSSSYEPSPSPQAQHYEQEPEEEEESNCVPKWGISIYSFQAEGGDELSVEENEQIYVLDYERTDGWWRVQKVDGDVGLVPSSYVQFDDEDNDHSTAAAAAAAGAAGVGTAAAAAAAASSRNDNVEEIRRKRAEEERALQQQRIAEERAREVQRRKEQEEQDRKRREQEEARRKEEEERRREEERQREEEERERRRQVQEAAKRAEAARQKQLEEDYRRKEAERKASLARSASKTRHQDLPKPDPAKIRTWTDRSGSFKVEAQFIDFHNGKLRLHKLNGVKIDVPVEKMCAEDIRWVENHTRRPSQDDEITPAMPPRPQQAAPAPAPAPAQPPQKKLNERWDWFDWFMVIGIPMQQSLQYAASFKAEKLDDSDIPNLTHKQMKMLGLKEEHVQRVERYIETGQPEETNEEEAANKKKELSQIEKDEELARKLQKEWESSENGSKGKAPSSNARPRPNVSAPKDVHPDLLDFIGSQLSSSSAIDNGKGKEPEKPKGDLIGFNDDAWTPRADSSPIAALSPMKTAQSSSSNAVVPPPAAPVAPAGPTPEQIKAAEAERKRIQEEEQIQKIQLMNLQRQAKEQQQQLEQLQKLTQQQLELQKQLAMQTGTQQQQQQQQQQMLQVQAQQQQLQQQLAQQPPQLQPSFAAQPTGFSAQPTGFNASQPTGFNASQPTGFNASQPTSFSPQQTAGFQNGFTGQSAPAGRQRPTPSHSLPLDPSLGQWQSNQPSQPTGFQQQPMQTGFQQPQPPQQPIQQNSWQALQPQMTGFPASSQPVGGSNYHQPLAPSSAAGQQGLSRSQTIGAQPTGRHWNSATPDNPFGSPTLSPLQAQMTGVQFSTPSPQAFHQSPLQSQQQTGYMQPQMTGFAPQPPPQQQQAGNSIFTPQGSMQYGQSAFPNNQRPW
ncbi:unnamed protein product [Mucor circinelloides]